MTETAWLTCSFPEAMLRFLRGRVSDRKLRLFTCACCRRVWDLLPDDANRNLVVAVEDYADAPSWPDRPDRQEEWNRQYPVLYEAILASSSGESTWGAWDGNRSYWAVKYLGRGFYKLTPLESAQIVAIKIALEVRPRSESKTELAAQARLLRDIIGPLPWRPISHNHSWLSADVKTCAQAIYDDRAFDGLPILADALEEAGCTDADILGHCRGPGPHLRGCWLVDLILGKK